VREVVEQQLRRIHGRVEVDRDGDFVVRSGEVTAWIRVQGLQPELTAVVVVASVAGPLERVDEACRFLAAESLEMPLGHFELHGDGRAVAVSHTLLGEFLSGEELRGAIEVVLSAAAEYGPRVRREYGGGAATPASGGPALPAAAGAAPAEELQRLLAGILAQAEQVRSPRPRPRARRLVLALVIALLVVAAAVALAVARS
jgi:hypothetical protein